jgi:photosystem II stability/assembly factor-like uncharacterized protein
LRPRIAVNLLLAAVVTAGTLSASAKNRSQVAFVATSFKFARPVTASFGVVVREACRYAPGHDLHECVEHVFSTNDNGKTWADITPRRWPRGFYVDDVQFLDESVGWVLDVYCGGMHSYLYRTQDGGATWRRSGIAPPGCHAGAGVSVSFSDPLHGWLVDQDPAAEYAAISRTTDGGATWLGPFGSGAADRYPSTVVRLGPGRGLGTIWYSRLVGTGRYGAGYWVERPLPPTARGQDRFISLPEMFGRRGVMTASLEQSSSGQNVDLQVLTTNDGGQSWTVAARIPDSRASVCPGAAATAATPRVWWVTCRSAHKQGAVRLTKDAGATWTVHRAPRASEDLTPLDGQVAWMTASHGEGSWLFVTEDGGATWRHVRPGLARA